MKRSNSSSSCSSSSNSNNNSSNSNSSSSSSSSKTTKNEEITNRFLHRMTRQFSESSFIWYCNTYLPTCLPKHKQTLMHTHERTNRQTSRTEQSSLRYTRTHYTITLTHLTFSPLLFLFFFFFLNHHVRLSLLIVE